jgi:transposase InsO family protein
MAGRDVPMSLRRLVVEVDVEGLNVSAFCRQHGIGRTSFYELRNRFAVQGEAALEPRSRAPRRVANRTPVEVEDLLVARRKHLDELGVESGPMTIHAVLCAEGVLVPSPATIGRILRRRGFVVHDPTKAPKRSRRSFTAERANECWQIDDTGWELADGTVVKIVDIVDDRTRLLAACRAVLSCNTTAALEVFLDAGDRWGLPERFLSDNARAFRHGLADALVELGIAAGHSRPYHPQTCGKVERFHQTLKKHLATRPPARTLIELQAQLDWFADYYNHQRPHRALRRAIPAQVWATTAKSGPAHRPLDAPTNIHRAHVIAGRVPLGRWFIAVGTRYDRQPAVVVLTGLVAHVFIDGRLVRNLTIDPTRRYQRLEKPPT